MDGVIRLNHYTNLQPFDRFILTTQKSLASVILVIIYIKKS